MIAITTTMITITIIIIIIIIIIIQCTEMRQDQGFVAMVITDIRRLLVGNIAI
jgi:hypothetical protein